MKKIFFMAAILLTLSACASSYRVPDELQYKVTSDEIENPAYLIGGDKPDPFPLFDHHTIYIYSIDGKILMTGRKGWSEKIPIVPGNREIGAQYHHGNYRAQMIFTFNFEPNKTYVIEHTTSRNEHVDYWIVDSETGEPVSKVARVVMDAPDVRMIPVFL